MEDGWYLFLSLFFIFIFFFILSLCLLLSVLYRVAECSSTSAARIHFRGIIFFFLLRAPLSHFLLWFSFFSGWKSDFNTKKKVAFFFLFLFPSSFFWRPYFLFHYSFCLSLMWSSIFLWIKFLIMDLLKSQVGTDAFESSLQCAIQISSNQIIVASLHRT